MIQAELRVGNWIYDDDKLYGKVIGLKPFDWSVRCDAIEGCDILVDVYLNDGEIRTGMACDSNNVSPIPLTPEILEKCGFEVDNKTSYGGWLSPNIGTGKIRLVKEDVGFSFFNGICKTVVKDLHTLQNYYPAWTSGTELIYKP